MDNKFKKISKEIIEEKERWTQQISIEVNRSNEPKHKNRRRTSIEEEYYDINVYVNWSNYDVAFADCHMSDHMHRQGYLYLVSLYDVESESLSETLKEKKKEREAADKFYSFMLTDEGEKICRDYLLESEFFQGVSFDMLKETVEYIHICPADEDVESLFSYFLREAWMFFHDKMEQELRPPLSTREECIEASIKCIEDETYVVGWDFSSGKLTATPSESCLIVFRERCCIDEEVRYCDCCYIDEETRDSMIDALRTNAVIAGGYVEEITGNINRVFNCVVNAVDVLYAHYKSGGKDTEKKNVALGIEPTLSGSNSASVVGADWWEYRFIPFSWIDFADKFWNEKVYDLDEFHRLYPSFIEFHVKAKEQGVLDTIAKRLAKKMLEKKEDFVL